MPPTENTIVAEIEDEWVAARVRATMAGIMAGMTTDEMTTGEGFHDTWVAMYTDVAGRVRRKYDLTSTEFEALFRKTTMMKGK